MLENRDFKGVWIPREIWLDKGLNPIEKVLLVEIDSLDNDPVKGCFAGNEYLAEFIQRKPNSTANMISSLRKRGYLKTVFWNGRQRGLRVCIPLTSSENESSLHKKVKADFTKKGKQTSQKSEHNNTVNNTGNIKTVKAKIDESKKLPSLDAEKKDRTPPSCAQPPQDFEAYHQEMMDTLKSGISDANIKAYTTGAMIQMTIPEFWQMVAEMIDHYADDYGFKKNPTGFIKRKVRGWLSSRKFRRTKTQKAAPKNDLKKGKFFDRPAARAANAAKWEIL